MNAATATAETTNTSTTTTESAQTTEKEVTLDDVYREAGLDKVTASDTTQQTNTTETKTEEANKKGEPSSVPDPYDTENFKAYLAREAAGKTELEKQVRVVTGYLNARAQQEAVAATKADIEKAVGAINEVVNYPKPKVIEAALDGMVREDPRLKAIWNNRDKNPGAWNNALKIVTKQIAEDFSAKVDPALVAAQRARKESQKQMATTTTESNVSPVEERLAAAQGDDFDREWQKLLGHG